MQYAVTSTSFNIFGEGIYDNCILCLKVWVDINLPCCVHTAFIDVIGISLFAFASILVCPQL